MLLSAQPYWQYTAAGLLPASSAHLWDSMGVNPVSTPSVCSLTVFTLVLCQLSTAAP